MAVNAAQQQHNDSTESTGGGAEKQPRLKYAAFAHIDLSSFDFQQKKHSNNGGKKNIELPLQEKSRSVVAALPKSLTYSGNAAASQMRSITRMSDQLETKSLNLKRGNLNNSEMKSTS